jgi:hypothetical protein
VTAERLNLLPVTADRMPGDGLPGARQPAKRTFVRDRPDRRGTRFGRHVGQKPHRRVAPSRRDSTGHRATPEGPNSAARTRRFT